MKESVLILIKPDGVQKKIAGRIIDQFLNSDLKLIAIKVLSVNQAMAEKHYGHLKKEFFFKQIVDYLCGKLHGKSPVIAVVLFGEGAIAKSRAIAGATNPEEANPISIRGKYGRITTKGVFENLVHVSSSLNEAKREIKLWFTRKELLKA